MKFPNSVESEKVVISHLLHGKSENLEKILDYPEDDLFFDKGHSLIFKKVLDYLVKAEEFDIITIHSQLETNPHYKNLGGLNYLTSLKEYTQYSFDGNFKVILNKLYLRRKIELATKMQLAAVEDKPDSRKILDSLELELFEVTKKFEDKQKSLEQAGVISDSVLLNIDRALNSDSKYLGLPIGFQDIDEKMGGLHESDLTIVAARASAGKDLADDEPVLCKDGWKRIGEITTEDYVCGSDGKFYKVLGVFPQGKKEVFKVEFSDGSYVRASGTHNWLTRTQKDRDNNVHGSVKSTLEIARTLKYGKKNNHSVPYVKPPEFDKKNLLIHPYVLGVILGDATFRGSNVVITNSESDIINKVKKLLPEEDCLEQRKDTRNWSICRKIKYTEPSKTVEFLRSFDIYDKLSYEKYIPEEYLYSSVDDRLNLLHGLLDTDGFVQGTSHSGKYYRANIEFSTTSKIMAHQVRQLVMSLGGRCTIKSRMGSYTKNNEKHTTRINYRVNIAFYNGIVPVSSEKHLKKWVVCKRVRERYISSVVPDGVSSCTCISVSSPDNLFVTRDYLLTHNSSFFGSIVSNLLLMKQPVHILIFSLEMTKRQLIERLISNISWIPLQNIRRGKMSIEEWARFLFAVDVLKDCKLYIDDTPGLNILQINTKVQNAFMRNGKVDLVIVDYLQLMSSVKDSDNRANDVSQIAWGLKMLGKAHNVPVMALSQLSRAPDKRLDHKPVLSDLRECVTGDTPLIEFHSGRLKKITELKSGDVIASKDENGKIVGSKVLNIWSTGNKQVYKVTTSTGNELKCTLNHPFFTARGWVPLGELTDNDLVGSLCNITQNKEVDERTLALCRFLGYMYGNGSFQKHRSCGFISADNAVLKDVKSIVKKYFPKVNVKTKKKTGTWTDLVFSQTQDNGYGKPFGNDLLNFFRDLEILGQRDYTKEIPDIVFEAGTLGAAEFISGYLCTDGCVKIAKNAICFDSTSRKLLEQVKFLLNKLGVVSSLGKGKLQSKSKHTPYRLTLCSEIDNIQRFSTFCRLKGEKELKLKILLTNILNKKTRNSLIIYPKEVSKYISSIDKGWRFQDKFLSKAHLKKYAEKHQDKILNYNLESDILWEKIKTIEYVGIEEVFDIEIDRTHNFIANGLCVHNSGAIEQHSDNVLFIYREELYNPTLENRNVAEIIIAKQRQGEICSTYLAFIKNLTKFMNVKKG